MTLQILWVRIYPIWFIVFVSFLLMKKTKLKICYEKVIHFIYFFSIVWFSAIKNKFFINYWHFVVSGVFFLHKFMYNFIKKESYYRLKCFPPFLKLIEMYDLFWLCWIKNTLVLLRIPASDGRRQIDAVNTLKILPAV